jgi:hypothetical protein
MAARPAAGRAAALRLLAREWSERAVERGGGGRAEDQRLGSAEYDAFGVFATVYRELEWKIPIFSWRVVPKTPNTSYGLSAFESIGRARRSLVVRSDRAVTTVGIMRG